MRKISKFHFVTIALIMGLMIGCSSSDGAGTIFIPDFTATWPVEGEEGYFMDLQYPQPLQEEDIPTHSGIIEGEEQHDDGDDPRHNNPLNGSFKGLDIEFTINRENGDVINFTGKMIPISETDHTIVRIELHSTKEGKLVLVQ